MGILAKPRAASEPGRNFAPGAGSGAAAADNIRTSNGLKEFLRHLGTPEGGEMLDLGPISQATVDFFTGRGYKLHSNDLLRAWHAFLAAELATMMAASAAAAGGGTSSAARPDPLDRAARFMDASLDYPAATFHGVLAWSLIDYLPPEAGQALAARLNHIVRPGGAVLAIFHNRPPERFHRYRVVSAEGVEYIPATAPVPFGRVLPNREILNLFSSFRSSKTFVGRDQIREALFMR